MVKMGSRSHLCLFFLLLLAPPFHNFSSCADARPLPRFLGQERYVKVLAALGMMCQCCDGAGGECRSRWESTCAKLECRPWKFF